MLNFFKNFNLKSLFSKSYLYVIAGLIGIIWFQSTLISKSEKDLAKANQKIYKLESTETYLNNQISTINSKLEVENNKYLKSIKERDKLLKILELNKKENTIKVNDVLRINTPKDAKDSINLLRESLEIIKFKNE